MSFSNKMKRNNMRKEGRFRALANRSKKIGDSARRQTCHAEVRQIVRDVALRQKSMLNLTTIFLLAANEAYGFGQKRLDRLGMKMLRHVDCIWSKMVAVSDIVHILRAEAGLDIRGESKEEYGTHDKAVQMQVVDEMSAAFLLSLLDEYGFKAVRLNRGYRAAAIISKNLKIEKSQWTN